MPKRTQKPLRILVTAAGSTTALSVMKGLGGALSRRYHLYGSDIFPPQELPTKLFCREVFQVARASQTKRYLADITAICRRKKIDVIIPIMDIEVEMLARHRDHLPARVMAASYETVQSCNDKYETYRMLTAAGIPAPLTVVAQPTLPQGWQYPVMIKPRRGVSSTGVYPIMNAAEMRALLPRVEAPIMQPLLKGDQYVVDVVCDENHRCCVYAPRWEKTSKSGVGTKATTALPTGLRNRVQAIATALRLVGPANMEFFKQGRAWHLIEVNPRFSAGSITTVAAGVPIHEIALKLICGERVLRTRVSTAGVTMTRFWQEAFWRGETLFTLPAYYG